ncbi:polysaccharide deacetylase family protein [Cupriavidus sp. AU9028]|nr:polysaccharide deacetylase family protein [Cupriavidus sp. AU9028]MBY4897832.1 polysaccharide deacetylase family protein [Cupriavidus sp. AU9028]
MPEPLPSGLTPTPPTRPWRPSPWLGAAAAVHVGALGACVASPALLPWALGSVAATDVVLAGAGLWPRSTLLGPNLRRLPASAGNVIALTFDDGPNPAVTPAVLDLLDAYGARATFFCVGETARRHPALLRQIVARGHAIENHTEHHWLHFSTFGPARIAREIADAQRVLTDLAGRTPRFFRAPAGLRNPLLEPALCRQGLRLASWTRRGFDTWRNADPDGVARRLLRGLAARDILLMHDGNPGSDREGKPMILTVLPRVLQAIEAAGLRHVTLQEAVPA